MICGDVAPRTTLACDSVVQLPVLMLGAAARKIQYSTPDSMFHVTVTLLSPGATLTPVGASGLVSLDLMPLHGARTAIPGANRDHGINLFMSIALAENSPGSIQRPGLGSYRWRPRRGMLREPSGQTEWQDCNASSLPQYCHSRGRAQSRDFIEVCGAGAGIQRRCELRPASARDTRVRWG